eukprot:6464066-Amphidinium_carterae.1
MVAQHLPLGYSSSLRRAPTTVYVLRRFVSRGVDWYLYSCFGSKDMPPKGLIRPAGVLRRPARRGDAAVA